MKNEHKNPLVMNREQIMEYLPHRAPFLLVHHVSNVEVGKKIVGYRDILLETEKVFEGHFPNYPIYPGVYILEGLAQIGGILAFMTRIDLGLPDLRFMVLTGMEDIRFKKPVKPGTRLWYEMEFVKHRSPFVWMTGRAKIQDELVAEASMSACVIDTSKGRV